MLVLSQVICVVPVWKVLFSMVIGRVRMSMMADGWVVVMRSSRESFDLTRATSRKLGRETSWKLEKDKHQTITCLTKPACSDA